MTIKEIAKITSVSRGTIDRVIHKRGKVKKETEILVLDAIKKYGYTPNKAGKALASIKKSYKIGIVIFKGKDDFYNEIIRGIKYAYDQIGDLGFQMIWEILEFEIPGEEVKVLDKLCESKVDAVIVIPIRSEAVEDALKCMSDKGVTVVHVNSDISNSIRMCFVGHDNYKSGRTAAQMICEFMSNNGNILIVVGHLELESHLQRLNGVLDYIKESVPNVNIVEIIDYEQNEMSIYKRVRQTSLNNDYGGVLVLSRGINDICSVLEETGRIKTTKIGTFDLNELTTEGLKSDIISFVIDQSPFEQGQIAMEAVHNFLVTGMTPVNDVYYTKTVVYVKENL